MSFLSLWIVLFHLFFLPLNHHYVSFLPSSSFRFPSQIIYPPKSLLCLNFIQPQITSGLNRLHPQPVYSVVRFPMNCVVTTGLCFPSLCSNGDINSSTPHSSVHPTDRPTPPPYLVVMVVSSEKSYKRPPWKSPWTTLSSPGLRFNIFLVVLFVSLFCIFIYFGIT